MEDWRQVGDPEEPQFQNGWDHAYRFEGSGETGIYGEGQWVLFPQEKPGTFKRVFLTPGFYPYPAWFIARVSKLLAGVSGKSILYPVEYRKDNEGFVYIVGIAKKANVNQARWNLETIFTLPNTHRPAYREFLGEPGWVSTFTIGSDGFARSHNYYLPGQYVIEPDGRLRIVRPNQNTGIETFYLQFRSKFLVLTPQ